VPKRLPAGAVVVVTGATGHLGQVLVDRLLRTEAESEPCGIELRTLARRPLPPALLASAPIEGQAGPSLGGVPASSRSSGAPTGRRLVRRLVHTCADIRSQAAREAIEDVDLVFHLAAQVWRGRGAGADEEMRSVNVDGTLNVLAGRPKAVVLASSAAVYGAWPDNPLPLDENCAPRPNRECPYAQHKLLAERDVARAAKAWTVLRICSVLGPHADQRVSRSLVGYRLGVPEVRGYPQALQWLDEADAAEALVRAGADLLGPAKAKGEVLNVATWDWTGAPDIARVAASRVLRAPRRAVFVAAELGKRVGLSPFGADRAALICGPLALSPAKATRLLSWQPKLSSQAVLAAALAGGWKGAPRNREPR